MNLAGPILRAMPVEEGVALTVTTDEDVEKEEIKEIKIGEEIPLG